MKTEQNEDYYWSYLDICHFSISSEGYYWNFFAIISANFAFSKEDFWNPKCYFMLSSRIFRIIFEIFIGNKWIPPVNLKFNEIFWD